MDKRPLFSITMATFNRAHLLSRAVNSVLSQSYENLELVIVDDASTDKTEELCRSFEDRRIIYYRLERNSGGMAARNKGFDLAKGYYTAILDDDDVLLPEAIEAAVGKLLELSQLGVRIVWFDRLDFERKQRSGYGIEVEGYIKYEDILCERIGGDFWLVMERDIITEDDRFDEKLWAAETQLWLRLHRKWKAYYVPRVLYINYREHGGERLSNSRDRLKQLSRSILTQMAYLQHYEDDMKQLCPRIYGRRLGILGASHILLGQKLEGRKLYFESLRYHLSLEASIICMLSFVFPSGFIERLSSFSMRLLDMKGHVTSCTKRFLPSKWFANA